MSTDQLPKDLISRDFVGEDLEASPLVSRAISELGDLHAPLDGDAIPFLEMFLHALGNRPERRDLEPVGVDGPVGVGLGVLRPYVLGGVGLMDAMDGAPLGSDAGCDRPAP